jgi:hypothetical protein
VGLVCVVTLAVCSSSTSLVAIGDPGSVCTPGSADGEATIGLDTLQSSASGPVEVTAVSLEDQDGLSLVGWHLVEPGDPDAKVGGDYDAPVERVTGVPAGARMVLVLGLHFDSAPGTATGVTVSFADGGRTGTTRTVHELGMVPAGQVCF